MDKQEKKKERRKTILILIGALFVIFGIFGGTFLSDAMGFDLLNIPKAPIPQDGQDSKSGGAGFVTPGQITDGSIFNHGQGKKAFSGFGDDGSLFEKTNTSASGINADGDSANGKDTGDGFLFTLKGTENGKEGAGFPLVPGTGSNSSSTSHEPGSSGPTSSDPGQNNSSGSGSSSGSSSSSPSSGTIIPGNRPTPGGGNHSVPISEVKLDQADVTINRHNTLQLTALISPANTTESKTTVWSSSNADVATVDSKGLVTGVNAGETAITAKVGSHTATCNVTVVVLIEGISINYEELSVIKGDTAQLTAKTIPEDTTEDKAIVWSSSDPEVATVDKNGLVTAIKTGKATIKAKSELTGFSGSCEITVVSPMTGISMDKTTLTVNRDRTDKLTVIFSPEDTTDDQTVTWSSSDPSIADVDQQGNVTGHKIGTATITAACGKFTATCDVTVVATIDNIYLDQPEMALDRGTNGQLTVSYEPPDTTDDKTVAWTSSNPEIATVDDSGKVTAISAGDATITAKVGTHTATCNVTVVVLIHNIAIENLPEKMTKGDIAQPTVSIDPPDTTEDKTAIWSSSNPDVATVDSTGKVTAVNPGDVTITVKIGEHNAQQDLHVRNIFTISTVASGDGSVSPGGLVVEDDSITLTATPNIGHHLKKWICSTGETRTDLSFSYVPTCDVTWTAEFEIDTYDSEQVPVPSSTGGSGKITPAPPYTFGQEVTYTATPATGYHFVNWTSNFGDTKSTQTFTWVLTRPITWTPHFASNNYNVSVTAVSDDQGKTGGTANGAGTYTYGSTATLSAVPESGYKFVNWTSNLGDTTTTPTFTYTLDSKIANANGITWTAHFTLDAFVTASIEDDGQVDGKVFKYGLIEIKGSFDEDDDDEGYAKITLTLDSPITVQKGGEILDFEYYLDFMGLHSWRDFEEYIQVYNDDTSVTVKSSFTMADENEDIPYTMTASNTVTFNKIVIYGEAGSDHDSDYYFYVDIFSIGGKSVSVIRGYNYE